MASSSNVNKSSPGEKYPYPTEFNVLDFVPKLSSEAKYDNWKPLMRDFIDNQGLVGFIDGTVAVEESKFTDSQGLVGSIDGTVAAEESKFTDSQGLVGSIDGTVAAEESNQHDRIAWKRSDNLVRQWILATLSEDTRLRVLRFKTAKDLWTELEKIFDASRSLWQLDEEMENRQGRYLALHKAAVYGDWDTAMRIIENDPNAVRTSITPGSKTALHIAVSSASAGRDRFVRELLEKMTPQDVVDLVDVDGLTALHDAATVANVEGARMLVNKNSNLPNVADVNGETPLHWAAYNGSREIILYLKEVTADDRVDALLLWYYVWGELYDIALTQLQEKPELAKAKGVLNPFDAIAEKRSSFPSGNSLKFWQRLIYSVVPMRLEGNNTANLQRGGGAGDIENQIVTNCRISGSQRLHFMIWEVAEKLVPCVKCIREKKESQHHALEFVKFLSSEVAKSKLSTAESIFKPALRLAALVGIPEIVEEIVEAYPLALGFVNLDELNIFKYAIINRRERVFNLIYQVDAGWRFMAPLDSSSNKGLHLAARLRRQQQINLRASAAGAILQMQREVQWFKEVEKFSLPRDKDLRNADGMTPAEVFSDTHQDLVKEGERWMKDTGTSCTIVAALIATMIFAAAITVPGGNDSNNGHPLLLKKKAFVIFGISNAVALFSSITSVLMFLLILTSRYAEEDFLYTLPNRLIIGLITLFFSILSTMVAFGAILYLVFGDDKPWILIPIVALASIPVTLFGALQFPLLIEMIQSTYGRGIFGKQSNRVLG